MTRTIRVLTGRDDTVTVVHNDRKSFRCPRCGQMIAARVGVRCTDCGAQVASVQATYPVKSKHRRKIEEPTSSPERDGMLGCLYGLYLRSKGVAPKKALKLIRERYPHL